MSVDQIDRVETATVVQTEQPQKQVPSEPTPPVISKDEIVQKESTGKLRLSGIRRLLGRIAQPFSTETPISPPPTEIPTSPMIDTTSQVEPPETQKEIVAKPPPENPALAMNEATKRLTTEIERVKKLKESGQLGVAKAEESEMPVIDAPASTEDKPEVPSMKESVQRLRETMSKYFPKREELNATDGAALDAAVNAPMNEQANPVITTDTHIETVPVTSSDENVATAEINRQEMLNKARIEYINARQTARSLGKSMRLFIGEQRSAKNSLEEARKAYATTKAAFFKSQIEQQEVELKRLSTETPTPEESKKLQQELAAFALQIHLNEEQSLDEADTTTTKETLLRKFVTRYKEKPAVRAAIAIGLTGTAVASNALGVGHVYEAFIPFRAALSAVGNEQLISGFGDWYAKRFGEQQELSDSDLHDAKTSTLLQRIAEFKEFAKRNPQKDMSGEIQRLEQERKDRLAISLSATGTVDMLMEKLQAAQATSLNAIQDDKIIRHRNTAGKEKLAALVTATAMVGVGAVARAAEHVTSHLRPDQQLINPFHNLDPMNIDGGNVSSLYGLAKGLVVSPDPNHLYRPGVVGEIWSKFTSAQLTENNNKVLRVMNAIRKLNPNILNPEHPDFLLHGVDIIIPKKLA